MEQFKFSLQKLLDIRQDKEEKSKQGFMEAQRQKNVVEEKLNSLKSDYSKYNVYSNEETLIQQKIKNNYLTALNFGINSASNELSKKDEIVEKKRQQLKQDQINRKTVEILKDKKEAYFICEQNRVEQVQNDEFALYSYIRKHERR